MSDNPSFVLKSVLDVGYEDRAIPEISDNEVLVKVMKTGICGSDVHYFAHGRIGDFIVENPMVLGHESSGIVFKVGSKVKNVNVGERVAIEPGAGCHSCELCKAGKYHLCQGMIFAATPPYDGTLARYYKVPADNAYTLPDGVSLEDGAMIEPLAVGVHSVATLGNFRSGQAAIVFGCGPVGLLCMAVAKALGASRVIAVDIVASRLDFAKQHVATHTYLPPPPNEGESKIEFSQRNAAQLKAQLGISERGRDAIDLVVDASGAEVSIQTAFYVAKAGGTIVQVGMGNPHITINTQMLGNKELNYKGSFRYGPGDYPFAIDLVAQGKIDLKPFVTHRYKFEDALVAFKATQAGKSEDGKAVIKIVISGPDVPIDSKL